MTRFRGGARDCGRLLFSKREPPNNYCNSLGKKDKKRTKRGQEEDKTRTRRTSGEQEKDKRTTRGGQKGGQENDRRSTREGQEGKGPEEETEGAGPEGLRL